MALDWDLGPQASAYPGRVEEIVLGAETACHLGERNLEVGRGDHSGGPQEVAHRSEEMEGMACRDRLAEEASYQAQEVVHRGGRMAEAFLAFLYCS